MTDIENAQKVAKAHIRALRYNGGKRINTLKVERINALEMRIPNLEQNFERIQNSGLTAVFRVNTFNSALKVERLDIHIRESKMAKVAGVIILIIVEIVKMLGLPVAPIKMNNAGTNLELF